MTNLSLKMIIIFAALFIAGTILGYFIGEKQSNDPSKTPVPIPNYTFEPQPTTIPPQSINPNDQIACTQDVKECPDGSFVGRSGPNCVFLECPK